MVNRVDVTTAKEDVSAGFGDGNGEGLGNTTQAAQDSIAQQVKALQAEAAKIVGDSYDEAQARLKISQKISRLQDQDARTR
ncbi:hypothetical protein FAI40_03260 [Acetobacteraceae bacterium]|nr:hypothetical protein FAI40_03260 [Acetobacteraceae bacterium]